MTMKLLKEPLLHFLVLGATLFGAYAWQNRGTDEKNPVVQVRIGEGDVQWLKETWARQWQREPTQEELRGLATEFLKEELLAREARAMGLDENDTVVRRRLAQKLEFLIQDTSRLVEPTNEDLQRFYESNPDRFSDAARVSFTHVFFNRDRRADAEADAKAAMEKLSHADAPASAADMGDRLLIDTEFHDADEQIVSGQFGRDFARAVFALKPGRWQGPIASGYGLHLVRISELKPARKLEFSEVRAQVLELWRDQRQREDNEKYFAGLLRKYDVVIDEGVKPLVGSLFEPINSSPMGKKE